MEKLSITNFFVGSANGMDVRASKVVGSGPMDWVKIDAFANNYGCNVSYTDPHFTL